MGNLKELDNTILGLIALHPGASGYDIHKVLKESTGYMISYSFGQIYPSLKKLHDGGLVVCEAQPIKNRLDKKRYQLTEEGRNQLREWLAQPVESALDFRAFSLKMAFAPLMEKDVLMRHVEREIEYRQGIISGFMGRDEKSFSYLDETAVNMDCVNVVWPAVSQAEERLQRTWLAWLEDFRKQVASL